MPVSTSAGTPYLAEALLIAWPSSCGRPPAAGLGLVATPGTTLDLFGDGDLLELVDLGLRDERGAEAARVDVAEREQRDEGEAVESDRLPLLLHRVHLPTGCELRSRIGRRGGVTSLP